MDTKSIMGSFVPLTSTWFYAAICGLTSDHQSQALLFNIK